MEFETVSDLLVDQEEDIELIKELFKATPEYGDFIVASKERRESFLNELIGIDK